MTFHDHEIGLNEKLARRLVASRRRAMVLAEVMVAVALSTILLGIVVTMLVSVRQWDQKFRNHGVHGDQLARLADSIRTDVRRGAEVSLPTANTLVVAGADKSQTRYELVADNCRRVVKRTADGSDEMSSLFTIGPAESWIVENGAPGRLPTTVVSVKGPQSDKSLPDSVLLVVCAAVGGDLSDSDQSKSPSESKPAP